jgi:hypothetical protein
MQVYEADFRKLAASDGKGMAGLRSVMFNAIIESILRNDNFKQQVKRDLDKNQDGARRASLLSASTVLSPAAPCLVPWRAG